ncbi:MAG: sugar ABC transporter permease [Treponema sp.]|nr:sugar ABC transporter permease [Treponema sp.]
MKDNKNRLAPPKGVMAAYLLPSLLLFVFVVIVPIFAAAYYSTFHWPGGFVKNFIGLDNYVDMLKDSIFWTSFGNNIFLTVFCLVGQIGLAFVFASFLNMKDLKMKGLHRSIAYFPVTVSAVVVGFVWTMIYDDNYGIINLILKFIGREDLTRPWLSEPDTIMTVVSIPLIWQYIGLYLVIILAAMTSISNEIFEMAEIDGAGGFKKAVYITLPMIRGTLITCVMLCISGNMRAFDHIYAMTRGGPGYASSVMAMYAYNVSFMQINMGYGSTLSLGILILSLALVLASRAFLTWVSRKGEI